MFALKREYVIKVIIVNIVNPKNVLQSYLRAIVLTLEQPCLSSLIIR